MTEIGVKEQNFISAVLYFYNEEVLVAETLEQITGVLSKHFLYYEVICVNDGSTDGTSNKITQFGESYEGGTITLLSMSYYQGLERSMRAGLDLSIGDFVLEFDTVKIDYDDELIMSAYHKAQSGHDIVSVSPNRKHKWTSQIFYKMFNAAANMNYQLQTETFRILSRRAINRVKMLGKQILYRKALYAKSGLSLATLYYTPRPCDNNYCRNDNYSSKRRETALTAFILFTQIAYKIAIVFVAMMIIFVLSTAVYSTVIYFYGQPIEGWTTIMLVLSFGFFGMFSMFAIILKYLTVILMLNFEEQEYIIESIKKLSE